MLLIRAHAILFPSFPSLPHRTISALTTPENVGTEQYCREVFNETHQVALCENSPKVASTIIQGTKRAIRQLQADFKQCKWNATTFHGKHLFGSFLLESVFVCVCMLLCVCVCVWNCFVFFVLVLFWVFFNTLLNPPHSGNRERAAVSAYTFLGPVKSLAEGCHEQKFENCQCEKKPSVTNGDGETTDFDCAELVEWPNMTMQRYTKGRRQSTLELTDLVDDHNEQVGARVCNSSWVGGGGGGTKMIWNGFWVGGGTKMMKWLFFLFFLRVCFLLPFSSC